MSTPSTGPSAQTPAYTYEPTAVGPARPLPAPEPKGLSVASMILALASVLFGFTFFVPLAAIITGSMGLRREPSGKPFAITGIIVGALCMLIWIVVAIIVIAALAAAGIITGIAVTTS